MFPGLPPARRRLRAVRHQLLRRRRLIAAALTAVAVLAALRTLAPPPPDTVDVLVAARDLPSGTLLGDDDLALRAYPAALAPDTAAEAAAGRVLAAPLGSGEVVTDARLVGPGLADAQPGRTVVPVRLPDAGMAALLRPGDQVDLVATDPGSGETSLVAGDVTVLATPRDVPEGPTGGSGGALVVVAATATEAVRIASAGLSQFLTVSWER
ncbi:Flp pilus assembly protein CpaB [Nocardioides cavernae]|uniref:Flp pilus assembly protein CpaB n=1 Tax=Nocardioides cavernae TaxID=1921566 RepID=A0A7Y9H159_9ACTN|nr:SAF domain-containing protein [Nocardioides cavernae]NYE35731.1 Flp pilus assembly protein CpaB [Nocardioides cavernae]